MTRRAVLEDSWRVAEAAAARIASAAFAAITARGHFLLGVSGGRTPDSLYRRLAADKEEASIEWERVRIFFADERAVPPDHADSNYRMVRESLIEPAGISPSNVHRMKGEASDLEAAALEYDALMLEPLDVLVLGIGEDGHTASLFPRSAILEERERRVAVVSNAPKPPARRLTLTPRAITEARAVLVLATGSEKAAAVAATLEGEGPASEVPARIVRERTWLVDRAAGALLKS